MTYSGGDSKPTGISGKISEVILAAPFILIKGTYLETTPKYSLKINTWKNYLKMRAFGRSIMLRRIGETRKWWKAGGAH